MNRKKHHSFENMIIKFINIILVITSIIIVLHGHNINMNNNLDDDGDGDNDENENENENEQLSSSIDTTTDDKNMNSKEVLPSCSNYIVSRRSRDTNHLNSDDGDVINDDDDDNKAISLLLRPGEYVGGYILDEHIKDLDQQSKIIDENGSGEIITEADIPYQHKDYSFTRPEYRKYYLPIIPYDTTDDNIGNLVRSTTLDNDGYNNYADEHEDHSLMKRNAVALVENEEILRKSTDGDNNILGEQVCIIDDNGDDSDSINDDSSKMYLGDLGNNNKENNYKLKKKFDGGNHGEIWKAYKINKNTVSSNGMNRNRIEMNETYILKRMLIEKGSNIWRCGLREVYFGQLLKDKPPVARYVEHFYRHNPNRREKNGFNDGLELWIVFKDEGLSLKQYLYSTTETSTGSIMYEHSKFWHQMRIDDNGPEVMKQLMGQLLKGISLLQEMNITHRDIKPSNLIVSHSTDDTEDNVNRPILKILDFSSAVDEETLHNGMYGDDGPTQDEETEEYMPPEVTFDETGKLAYTEGSSAFSYDSWSIGIVMLEMILGTPHVFTVDQRTRAILTYQLEHETEAVKRKIYLLAAMADFCIYSPEIENIPILEKFRVSKEKRQHSSSSSNTNNKNRSSPESSSSQTIRCTLTDISMAIRQRDPLDVGFNDKWGVDLIQSLLQWDPSKRILADEALLHAYFMGPYISSDGEEHATARRLEEYESLLRKDQQRNHFYDYNHYHYHNDEECTIHPHLLSPPLNNDKTQIEKEKGKREEEKIFSCPKCGRKFDSWSSCNSHTYGRKHGEFCKYDTYHHSIPDCATSHSIFPFDPHSGWCDVQGRRSRIEDYHSLDLKKDSKFYGVFDGHWGTRAAKFASKTIQSYIEKLQQQDNQNITDIFTKSFLRTNKDFRSMFPLDKSGATATVAIVTKDRLAVANVGDSRAILCCDDNNKPIQLTKDHTPILPEEKQRIEQLGGFVEFYGTWRVQGKLAVSRSIGDKDLEMYLSREPHVTILDLSESSYKFMVLASDGLWDVMENDEVVKMVQQLSLEDHQSLTTIRSDHHSLHEEIDFQNIARRLTIEAYVRGSMDNIGVCVADLRPSSREYLL